MVYNFSDQIEMDAFRHKLYLDNKEKNIIHHEMVERKYLITFFSWVAFILVLLPFSCLLVYKFVTYIMKKISFLYYNISFSSNFSSF